MSFYGDAPAELIYAMPAIGGAVTGTVTIGSAAGGPLLGNTTYPAELPHNYFSKAGKSILVEGGGIATTGTTTPTLKLGVALDSGTGVATASIVASTGAFTTVASLTTQWYFRVLITATAVGSSGTLQAIGLLHWGLYNLTTSVPQPTYLMGAGSTTPVSFATNQTTPVFVEPFAYWSATTTSLSMTMTNLFVWGLN
jgi:hypothetical protein